MRRLSRLVIALPIVVLAHCGGSSSTNLGSGDDASTSSDASLDGSADGSGGDATTGEDGGGDDSSNDSSTESDTATGDDAADAATCASSATRADCVTCCTTAHPQGAQTLASDELACACTPEDCGPVEGGSSAGDAGDLGTGACTSECAAPGHAPGATCAMCLRRSVGSAMTHGPCYTQVSAACESDDACKAYATCELTCPAN
jgi:hypothetical protein